MVLRRGGWVRQVTVKRWQRDWSRGSTVSKGGGAGRNGGEIRRVGART